MLLDPALVAWRPKPAKGKRVIFLDSLPGPRIPWVRVRGRAGGPRTVKGYRIPCARTCYHVCGAGVDPRARTGANKIQEPAEAQERAT